MQKNNKVLFCTLALLLISTLFIVTYNYSVQRVYAENLVRFHVIPNSDSAEDQLLKISVRDVIVNEMKSQFTNVETKDEAVVVTKENLDLIEQIALEQVALEGKNYSVEVVLGEFDFPARTYQDITLPSGKYQAVRVVIGEGNGQNWWCVLFPPLCFVDGVQTLEEGEQPKGVKVFEKDNIEYRIRALDFFKTK